jgi:hypothetical protein
MTTKNKKVNTIVEENINAIGKFIDSLDSKPIRGLDFSSQENFYSELINAINKFLTSEWIKNRGKLDTFPSWLEFPEGTPSQKTINHSSYTLANGGKTSDGKKLVVIAILKKTINEANESNNPRMIIIQAYWQALIDSWIQIGKSPSDKIGALSKEFGTYASECGFNVSKGKSRHSGWNVFEPSEALTKWIDDQKFDEKLLLVQLNTLYTPRVKTRAGSKTIPMFCKCFSARGNEKNLKAWIANMAKKGFKACPVCNEKWQIKN